MMKVPLRIIWAIMFSLSVVGSVGVSHGAAIEVSGILFHQRTVEAFGDDFQALRLGGNFSEGEFGFWGFIDAFNNDHGQQATYGEFAGIRSVGDWSLSGGGGAGNDPKLRPTGLILGDVTRRITRFFTSLYTGFTESSYRAGSNDEASSLYQFYRIGALVSYPSDWQLNLSYQRVQREMAGHSDKRLGSSGGISLTRSLGDSRIGATVTASCLGLTIFCRGGSLERYAEFFLDGRLSLSPQYGLIGRMGFINQSNGAIAQPAPGFAGFAAIAAPDIRRTQLWVGGYRKL